MAGSLTLSSWPGTTGFDPVGYFNEFLEQMQSGMPGGVPGVLPYSSDQILGAYSSEFKVTGDSSGMQVKVNQGRIYCKGIFAKLQDAAVSGGVYTLTVTAAHATLYRIDTVVVEVTFATGACVLKMLDGTAAALASVVPATLTQNATTWDIPLGYVAVDPTVTTISVKDVMDIRPFAPTMDAVIAAVSQRNPIINGGMDDRLWNDGTTLSSIADGTYGPEMWRYGKAGAIVHDLKQTADVPAVAANVIKAVNCLHLDVTTADSSIATGDFSFVEQRIEGYRARRILQYGGTLPVWIKDTIVGWHAIAFVNSGGDRSCVFDVFIPVADTWTLVFVHVPPSPTAGTWDYTTGIGLRVIFAQACGATFQATTPGAWETGLFYGTARTVNSNSSTSNNYKLWGVGPFVRGNLVLPFAPHDDEEVLARRYYQVLTGGAVFDSFGAGQCSTTTTCDVHLPFLAPMRANPTLSVSAASDFEIFTASSQVVCTAVAALATGVGRSLAVRGTVASGLTAGNAGDLVAVSSSAKLKLSARL